MGNAEKISNDAIRKMHDARRTKTWPIEPDLL